MSVNLWGYNMRISDLIAELQYQLNKHGDIPVCTGKKYYLPEQIHKVYFCEADTDTPDENENLAVDHIHIERY